MKLLTDGNRLFLEVEEWLNTLSGRGTIKLLSQDEDGHEWKIAHWRVYLPGYDYAVRLAQIFPWANLQVDAEFYREYSEKNHFGEESLIIWDPYDKEYIDLSWVFDEENKHYEQHDRYDEQRDGLYPYDTEAGELAYWRLELSLNEIGLTFLKLDSYLRTGTFPRRLRLP